MLIRGQNQDQIPALIDFAETIQAPIRFIELMPVSSSEMLDDSHFLSIREVQKNLGELHPIQRSYGAGPAKYFYLAGRQVVLGFIGALTDLHFANGATR